MTHRRALLLSGIAALTLTATAEAQTTATGAPPAPAAGRPFPPIPPAGIALPEADRTELTAGTEALGKEIDALRVSLKDKPKLLRYLPDVQIYYNAVHYPLTYNEFYDVKEVAAAKKLLAQGMERAKALREGSAPWATQTGLVALGYVSKIDGSVQPYGMVIPTQWTGAADTAPRRLDFFLHGRNEKLTELNFIGERQRSTGEFTPAGAFVLHPYGRYCNANRYAGEVDLLEALADAKSRYPIDDNRVVMRGFSMGGAASWQFAVHYAGLWAAAAPGAGFTETAKYTGAFAPDKTPPPWYEQKLWHLYDSVDYAANLFNCPTIAYSGEIDRQKQAADNMAEAMQKEGMTLVHVIGPQTAHKYHPDSKVEINRRVDEIAAKGRAELPTSIKFTTWTLRYNQMRWLTVEGLRHHWERARVVGELVAPDTVKLTTENVSALSLNLPAAYKNVLLDGQKRTGSQFMRDDKGNWSVTKTSFNDPKALRKRPGLQGPIDDAFMDSFVMVRPTGKPLNEAIGAWTTEEQAHAQREWRKQFRAEAHVVDDTALTDDQIKNSNLVLWGDPSSNKVLAKIIAKLPIRWEASGITANGKSYPVGTSVPVFIYPNPLNPSKYVVINSGMTFREGHYYTNAQQTPKLPDWAVVDITTPPGPRALGRIADAGFFDEQWRFQPAPAQ
jgi:pimeloyl-ACP methyl ester carboxylesterase